MTYNTPLVDLHIRALYVSNSHAGPSGAKGADEQVDADFEEFDDRQNAKTEIETGLPADVADEVAEVVRRRLFGLFVAQILSGKRK